VVIATIPDQKKLRNMRRDPRVTVSWETENTILQELAYTYIGPGVKFPPMPDPAPGFVTRISIDHIGGIGPWISERQ
jgi:hypothetical protein